MTGTTERARSRQWADVLTILTGVTLVASSLWPAVATTSPPAGRQIVNPVIVIVLRLVVGFAAIGALVVAQRWRRRPVARGILGVGALALLIGAFADFRDLAAWEFWSMVVPAVALLAAAVGIGPMPEPD